MNSFGALVTCVLGYSPGRLNLQSPGSFRHIACGIVPPFSWGTFREEGLLSGSTGEEDHHGHLRLKNACFPWLAVPEWKLEFEMSSECHHMPLRPSNGVSAYEESSFSPSLAEIFTSKADPSRLRFCLFFLVRSQIMKMLLIRKDKYIRQV